MHYVSLVDILLNNFNLKKRQYLHQKLIDEIGEEVKVDRMPILDAL